MPGYDGFLERAQSMGEDEYWSQYGQPGEFKDGNFQWRVFASGDTGWYDDEGWLWIGSNKGIAGGLGLWRSPHWTETSSVE